jgi:hypothetical protein
MMFNFLSIKEHVNYSQLLAPMVKTIPIHNMAILNIKLLNKTHAFAISS